MALFIGFIQLTLISDFIFWVYGIYKWGWYFPPFGNYQLLIINPILIFQRFGSIAFFLGFIFVLVSTLFIMAKFFILSSLKFAKRYLIN